MRKRRAEGRARLAFEPAPGLSKRRVLNNILLTTACATVLIGTLDRGEANAGQSLG